jgi:hypothetical protein
MKTLKNVVKSWIPLTVVITLLTGTVYGTVQQLVRLGADDTPIRMAEDTASALANGQPAESGMPPSKVEISQSLAPYVVVFDDSGKAIASSGVLHGQLPSIPTGVFDQVRRNGEGRITWQPEPGVRSATVIVRYGGSRPGFVMAGRSLREVENRIDTIGLRIGMGWLATEFAAMAVIAGVEFLMTRFFR